MALFIAVLGGVAVAEVHRAITKGGNEDVEVLKQKEEALKQQLKEIQNQLEEAKKERELTSQEAAQLAVINAELQKAKDDLEKESKALKQEKEELKAHALDLTEREQLLEHSESALKLENNILIEQFEKLKEKYDEEAASFKEQLQNLKDRVASTLQQFTSGDINAQDLVKFLSEMGVTLHCSEEDMARLERVAITASEEQRTEALGTVELKVDDSWMQQMRLVNSSQELAARLLRQGSAARLLAASSAAASPIASSVEAPRSLEAPKALETTDLQVPALKETPETDIDAAQHDTIPALRASPEEATNTDESANGNGKSQGRSLVFRPIKKAVAKALKNKQPLVEVEGPVARLTLDDVADGPIGNKGTLVAM